MRGLLHRAHDIMLCHASLLAALLGQRAPKVSPGSGASERIWIRQYGRAGSFKLGWDRQDGGHHRCVATGALPGLVLACGAQLTRQSSNGATGLAAGASAGLGLESAKVLAARGADVILAVRNPVGWE